MGEVTVRAGFKPLPFPLMGSGPLSLRPGPWTMARLSQAEQVNTIQLVDQCPKPEPTEQSSKKSAHAISCTILVVVLSMQLTSLHCLVGMVIGQVLLPGKLSLMKQRPGHLGALLVLLETIFCT